MARGKRYQTEGKLNYTKVFAVIIAIAVLIMVIIMIRNVLKQREKVTKNYQYFVLYSQNKWGVINQDGDEVIQPSYQEMIVIPNKEKDVFIRTYDVDENSGTYKTKAINEKNEEILTEYDQIEPIENIDKNNNVWYEKNILKVEKSGKYGLIDLTGKEVLPLEYDEISGLDGQENSIIIKKDGKLGLVNDNGNIIIEANYKDIKILGETYKEGYITVDENEKYGVVSATKKQILENNYDEISSVYLKEYYLVKENGKQKVINSKGETILDKGFDELKSATTNGFIFVKNNLYGEINTSGEVTLEAKYQDLKEIKDSTYIAKLDNKYGIIDNIGNVQVELKYTGMTYNEKADLIFAENADYQTSIIDNNYQVKATGILSEVNTEDEYIRMRINNDYKYYSLKGEETSNINVLKNNTIFLSKEDGKYGYVDKKGKPLTEYIYDDATEQNEYGYAAVKKDGKWGSINKNGEEVAKPQYDLENNLKIDFIGKWHLGEDLNMNYYCEK